MPTLLPPQATPARPAAEQRPGAWADSLPFAWRYPRWNFSRHAASFRAADAFVVSIQKSGRTWVRVFLTAYFSEWGKQNFSPAARPAAAAAMPALCYTHDLWEHKAKERFGERLRGKWLIPREECLNKPILLVVRDPRDQMVSLFFHLKKRTGTFAGDLPALLRHRVFGVERVVNIMNRWIHEWAEHSRLHVLRYEDARRDPETTFAAALRFLLPTLALDPAALSRAVEISSFENMRLLEAGTKDAQGTELVADLNTEALRPKDAADPDSYKVRRGKVGGFADYLAAPDIEYLNSVVATLDPRYGYGGQSLVEGA
jgi:hypothetical protein